MHTRMTRMLMISTAALLTGCVPSVDPAEFDREYGQTVGLDLPDRPETSSALGAEPVGSGASFAVASQGATPGNTEPTEEAQPPDASVDAPPAGFSEEELAYLTLLFDGAGLPFDLSGDIPADNDGDGIPNIVDPDVDGDGIPNATDPDVDGDGEPNSDDADIDGDGVGNDDDPDIDGDGQPNEEDADDDGDGLSDRWDLNDDGDDEPDDEDSDDDGEGPSDTLEDLLGNLQNGQIDDSIRDAIAAEISGRLNDPAQRAVVRGLIDDLELQASNPARGLPPLTIPPAINAIDELYRQLDESIAQARRSQPNPRGPLLNTRMQAALNDFIDRGTAMKRLGAIFPTVPLNEFGEQVSDLRTAFSGDRLREVATRIGEHVRPEARGDEMEERRELEQIGRGAASLGRAFEDDDPADILDGVDRLRRLADKLDDEDERDAFYDDLLGRVDELKETGLSLDEALEDVERENDLGDGGNDP